MYPMLTITVNVSCNMLTHTNDTYMTVSVTIPITIVMHTIVMHTIVMHTIVMHTIVMHTIVIMAVMQVFAVEIGA